MTITERVLAYLKEKPGIPADIAKNLNLTKQEYGCNWGKWDFAKAEEEGLIEWVGQYWHLVKKAEI